MGCLDAGAPDIIQAGRKRTSTAMLPQWETSSSRLMVLNLANGLLFV